MKIKLCIILVVLVTIFSINGAQNSFGHGLGTETMPPVMINGKSATLEVGSSTAFDTGIQQITIILFESGTGEPIKNTSFEVELIKSDKSLFKNNFEREDGILIMNLVPSDNVEIEILNQETFESFFGIAADQFNVKGKMFENGGLYKFNIKIIGINSFDNLLSEPVNYNLGISIPETTYYEIDGGGFGKQEIGVRTYYEQISDFNYDTVKKLITITMPFEWNEETIIQSSVVHEEILVPKTFGVFLVNDFVVYLNEILLPETVINIDDLIKGLEIFMDTKKKKKADDGNEVEGIPEKKGKFKEDVEALIKDEDTLSEGFKEKAATIFETALASKVNAETAKLEEQYASDLAGEVEAIKEDLVDKVDGYLTYVVENWMKDNEVAIEHSLKSEITESFISSLGTLFKEHHINVPDDAGDILDSLSEEAKDAKAQLNDATEKAMELSEKVKDFERKDIIREACEGLTATEAAKVTELAEAIEADDNEAFATKVATIKESYLNKDAAVETSEVDGITEDSQEEKPAVSAQMQKYLDAMART